MKISLFLFLIVVLQSACNSDYKPSAVNNTGSVKRQRIAVIPLGKVDEPFIAALKNGFSKKLAADFIVLDQTALPASAFYKPRQRYIADTLLSFLERENHGRYDKIIGITTQDISTRKGDIENWGILGLGNCPGESCVISSFRAGRNKVPYKQFIQRMSSLGLHEIGHTYGLRHCPEATCVMVDAEGKMKLDNGDSFCNDCRSRLIGKGILQ